MINKIIVFLLFFLIGFVPLKSQSKYKIVPDSLCDERCLDSTYSYFDTEFDCTVMGKWITYRHDFSIRTKYYLNHFKQKKYTRIIAFDSVFNAIPSNQLSNLKVLELSYRNDSFPYNILKCSNLYYLKLSANSNKYIPESLNKLQHLRWVEGLEACFLPFSILHNEYPIISIIGYRGWGTYPEMCCKSKVL